MKLNDQPLTAPTYETNAAITANNKTKLKL
jgi:hypothetical protein